MYEVARNLEYKGGLLRSRNKLAAFQESAASNEMLCNDRTKRFSREKQIAVTKQ